MKNIEFIKSFELGKIAVTEKTKEVKQIFNGTYRRMVSVELRNGEVLSKHKAIEPITVFCLAGSGIFRAGNDLEEELTLEAGSLITLESGVAHEVIAQPDISLLVTKFKDA